MAGSVDESYHPAVAFNRVSTDMLSYAARFTLGNMSFADRIKQRSFAVVNMAHDRDNGRTGNKIFLCIHFFGILLHRLLISLCNLVLKLDIVFHCNKLTGLKIDILIDVCNNAHHEQLFENFRCGFSDFFGEITYRYRFCRYNRFFDNNGFGFAILSLFCGFLLSAAVGSAVILPVFRGGSGFLHDRLFVLCLLFGVEGANIAALVFRRTIFLLNNCRCFSGLSADGALLRTLLPVLLCIFVIRTAETAVISPALALRSVAACVPVVRRLVALRSVAACVPVVRRPVALRSVTACAPVVRRPVALRPVTACVPVVRRPVALRSVAA